MCLIEVILNVLYSVMTLHKVILHSVLLFFGNKNRNHASVACIDHHTAK